MTFTPIAEGVQAMGRQLAGQLPAEISDVFRDEQAEFAAAGMPAGVAAVGTVVPDADLLDPHAAPLRLYEALGGGVAVIVLYRGAWCPYCNLSLSVYQSQLLPELRRRAVPLTAISPQHPDGSLTMRDKHALAFAVLSDPGNAVARALGVLRAPSAAARRAQLELGLDLEAVNADGTTAIPMPTTVVLGADRKVRWIDVHPDYTRRSEPEEILAAVEAAAR